MSTKPLDRPRPSTSDPESPYNPRLLTNRPSGSTIPDADRESHSKPPERFCHGRPHMLTERDAGNVSRRNFIKGVIAAGAAVSSASYLFRTQRAGQAQASAPGSVERLITLTVNGQERRVDVMKQETLAQTLRYKLGLTGTKLGCDRAECGACTVLMDDVPRYSCSVLTHTVRGKKITTIEGLAAPTGRCIRCSRAWWTSRASSARSACRAS